mmetsp:Transcript_55050/g.112509  ORF Transcript_55050/g.112509 Transcript_55050/m.112509 type:complete len:522 (+) Transcript_55050:92-1657(+)
MACGCASQTMKRFLPSLQSQFLRCRASISQRAMPKRMMSFESFRERMAKKANNSYPAKRVDASGNTTDMQVSVAELLRGKHVHARDLISLGIQQDSNLDAINNAVIDSAPFVPTPTILPRNGVVLLALGNIKALLFRKHVLVFEARLEGVSHWVEELNQSLEADCQESESSSFDIFVLEHVLSECCDLFDRRVNLYRRIVQRLSSVEQDMTTGNLLMRLLPLRDSLQQFEAVVKETRNTLIHLDQEDMLGILLNQQAIARESGTSVDPALHETVELLIENYLRHLSKTLNEVNYLQWRVATKQDLARISLDIYRNRMLRVDVQLAIGSVSIGASAVIAGLFGMNIPIGLEESQGIFIPVMLLTVGAGWAFYYVIWSWTSGYMLRKHQEESMIEQQALQAVFADMGALDLVIRKAYRRQMDDPSPLDLNAFDKLMRDSVKGRSLKPTKQEVALMFDLLDATQDGSLHRYEVFALQAEACRAQLNDGEVAAVSMIDSENEKDEEDHLNAVKKKEEEERSKAGV